VRSLPRRRQLAGYLVAAATIPLLALVLAPLRGSLQTVLLILLLDCVVVSVVGGLLPAVAATMVAFTMALVWFTPPYGSFAVEKQNEWGDLVVFLAVTILVGVVVEAGGRDRARAERARVEAARVADLGRREHGTDTVTGLLEEVRVQYDMDAAALAEGPELLVRAGDAAGAESLRVSAGGDLELVLFGPELLGVDRDLLTTMAVTAGRLWRSGQLAGEAARAEQLEKVDQLRSSILAAVGHDLRTPLADTADLLADIEASTDRLSGLIADLLDMSRLQAGAMSVFPERVAVGEVLTGALRSGGQQVTLEVPEDLPLVVADPALLERVLENLVENARLHAAAGGVTIRGRQQDGRVLVEVVDHGPGVPPERYDEIFVPFQRLDDRHTRGVGLGLAIARGFAEAQGATLAPSGTPGGGLTMTVSLEAAR
jgi:two-component system sensor histidine kinase KdpD